jgi:hypothetical protein
LIRNSREWSFFTVGEPRSPVLLTYFRAYLLRLCLDVWKTLEARGATCVSRAYARRPAARFM